MTGLLEPCEGKLSCTVLRGGGRRQWQPPYPTAKAVKWFYEAAEQGHADAQNDLGTMYVSGRGIAQSDTEAVKWFRRAADQGNAVAQYNVGLMYQNGRGLAQSDIEAAKWYRKAADQGSANA